jgi:DHA2 family multidrug resistance protein
MLGRQANMLSYQNAFWLLSVIMACLVPLPFIMRKPPPRGRAAPEEVAH